MAESEARGSLGLILGLLDDLFGGRARLHLFDHTTRVLTAAGVDEPAITAPGPLHRALETADVVVDYVGAVVPSSWSTSYRAWMPRGDCHLVACRVEGGGEVVGVLSVLRSESTTVPVAEDSALVGALAARLGRSAAVILMRAASSPASRHVMDPDSEVDIDLRTELGARPLIIERLHETRPNGRPPLAQFETRPPIAAVPIRTRLPGSAASVLRFDQDRVEVSMADATEPIDARAEEALVVVLESLARPLADLSPESGLRIDFAPVEDAWVATIRPRLLSDGWQSKPSVTDRAIAVADEHGVMIDVLADPDLGWVIEIRTAPKRAPLRAVVAPSGRSVAEPKSRPVARADTAGLSARADDVVDRAADDLVSGERVRTAERTEPDAADVHLDDAVDLMAASLGDTAHMLLIAISADGRIVFCNDELAARLGRSVADLLGRPFKSVRSSGEGWDEFGQLFARVIDEGLAQQTLAWPHAETIGQEVRWTVSRSMRRAAGQEVGPVYLCFGVDA